MSYTFGSIINDRIASCLDVLMYASEAPETVDDIEVSTALYELDILQGILDDMQAIELGLY